MFHLPVCPCCGTVYRYGDVRRMMRGKEQACYHCREKLTVSRRGWWVLGLLTVALSVGCNLLLMTVFHNTTYPALFFVTMLWIVAAYFLRPFFISLIKR